jgi:putative peptidoglycan lipid II flippase
VPLFAKELEGGGKSAAREFAEQILSVLILVLLILSALALIFMPQLVGTIIAPKFAENPDKFELTVLLTRIMFPYLLAMSLVAMLSGILNAFRRYFLAAFAPVILNIVFIAVLVFGGVNELGDADLGKAMAWGVFASGILQLCLLVYGIRKEGFPLSLRMPRMSPPVKRLLILAVPTAIAGGITQVNLLVGQIIASAQAGGIAVMNYADRLIQLPLGIIGISIGVVLLPELTRALTAKDSKEASHLQNRSLEFGLGLTVPAAVGLFMLNLPLVALVYERGAFDRETAELTAHVLAGFAIGLPSFVLIKIFQPSFYAREDMKTPMVFSGVNAVVNIILSLLLFPIYGIFGLAIATSSAGWINALMLWASLYLGRHFQVTAKTLQNILLICVASLIMAGIIYGGEVWLGNLLTDSNLFARIGLIGGLIAISAFVYFVIVIATGAVSRDQMKRILKR